MTVVSLKKFNKMIRLLAVPIQDRMKKKRYMQI